MCCRFLLTQQHYRDVLARIGVAAPTEFVSRYNITPGTDIPVVRRAPKKTSGREAAALHWGLVPAWAKDAEGPPLVNARAESLADKPSFRDALHQRRCIIPASGFYEWAHHGRVKKPWLFRRRDEQPFGLAGLWETWRAPNGNPWESCAIITTEPNTLMQPIHHRMPVMIDPRDFSTWLEAPVASAVSLLVTPASDAMTALAVTSRASNVRNDDPSCLEPESEEQRNHEAQLSLEI